MENLLSLKPYVLLLGAGRGSSELIHALNKDYDIEPCLYAGKRLAVIPGVMRCKYTRLQNPYSKYCVIQTLLDFNDDTKVRQTSLLVPCTPEYARLTEEYRETLEAAFIIAPLHKLRELLPTLTQKRR